jgi:hypothetical protein
MEKPGNFTRLFRLLFFRQACLTANLILHEIFNGAAWNQKRF